jgi:hypothetical protein
MIRLTLCLALISTSAFAQAPDATQRQRAALPFVIEQRNNALDGVALCQGDLTTVQEQFMALRKELDATKAELNKLTKKDTPE